MSVTNKTPTNPSVTTGTVFTPTGEPPADYGYTNPPIPLFSQILGDFTLTTYEFPEDGSSGIALYNGKSAWHIDNLGNMIFTTSQAPQSGCGGKMVSNSEAVIEKSGSISIEVTGRPNDGEIGKEKNSEGGIDEKKLPAYSLKVYGDVLIECIGGEAIIKGDNITLNASSTLNLNSGKDINISAGGEGGRINMTGGTFALNTGFFEKNLSGGEYSKGAGEVQIEQYNPNATTSVSTPGSVNYTVNGDYEVGVTGNYKQIVNKNYALSVDQDYGHTVKGNYSEKIEGKQKTVIDGKSASETTQKENYLMEIGAGTKETAAFKVSSGSDVEMETTTGGFTFQAAKQASKMTLTEKEFKVNVGKELGAIELTETQALFSYGKTSKITLEAARIAVEATAIYLN
jgi:hypothetical protein